MTTYILHGGNTSKEMPSNREFFSHFTESVPEKYVNILICYWASTKDTWKDKFEEDKKSIRLYNKKQFNTQIVTDPDDLKQHETEAKIKNAQSPLTPPPNSYPQRR